MFVTKTVCTPLLYTIFTTLLLIIAGCGGSSAWPGQKDTPPPVPEYNLWEGIAPYNIEELPCLEGHYKNVKTFLSRISSRSKKQQNQYYEVSIEEVRKETRLWHDFIIKDSPLVTDERATFLESIITRFDTALFKKILYTDYAPYTVFLIESDEIQAFSTGGGYIYLTTELYKHATDEAQLAFCIAREISHTFLEHYTQDPAHRKKLATQVLTGSWKNVGIHLEDPLHVAADFSAVCLIYNVGYHPEQALHLLNTLREHGMSSSLSDYHISKNRMLCLADYLTASKQE